MKNIAHGARSFWRVHLVRIFSLSVAALAVSFVGFCMPLQAQWQVGDVFVGTGKGNYLVYRFNGTKYTLVQTIAVAGFGSTDQTSGCAFDSQLNFYATDTTSGLTAELNGKTQSVFQTLSTGAGTTSVMFDSSGTLYVGLGSVKGVAPSNGLLQYVPSLPPDTSTGNISYPNPATPFNASSNTDWIDLVNNQKTLYSTNETATVQSEDLSAAAPTQAPFGSALPGTAHAIRALSPFDGSGGFLVTAANAVVKLDGSGNIVATYTFGNKENNLQPLTLDPNGTSAWVVDFKTGDVFRFNIATGAVEFKISTPGSSSPNGLCVRGGPELNVAPLVYNVGTNVKATAEFGAPGTANFHTWQATFDNVTAKFVLVITATEGIDLHRYDEHFCNQAVPGNSFGCSYLPPPPFTATLTPIPYADQLNIHGKAQAGKPVVYRVANPLDASYTGNISIYGEYSYPPSPYTPPTCTGPDGKPYSAPDPRAFRAPSSAPPPDAGNLQFAFDFTTFTGLGDHGWGGGTTNPNDYNVADRCPADCNSGTCVSTAGSSMTFLSPLPKQKVTLGSSLPISISAVDAFGNPITDLTSVDTGGTSDLSLSISQFELPLAVFGVEGNSPDFFKITKDDKYKANLDTGSVTGLQLGPATLCVTSIDLSTYNKNQGPLGTGTVTAIVPPVCTTVQFVP